MPELAPAWAALPESIRGAKVASVRGEQVRHGRGAVVQWRLGAVNDRCPLLRQPGQGCALWGISTGMRPAEDAWWLSSEALPAVASVTIAPREWIHFVGGRERVYAQRAGRVLAVDLVSDEGELRGAMLGPGGWLLVDVIEGKRGEPRLAVVAWDPTRVEVPEEAPLRPHLGLAVARIEAKGEGWEVGEPAWIGVRGGLLETARDVRAAARSKQRVMVGPFSVVKLLDDPREDAWALVWIEAEPPARRGEPGVTRVGGKGKHFCGSPRSSRPLSDRTIVKRLHVSRFVGSEAEGDAVLAGEVVGDPGGVSLGVEPVAEGVLVRGKIVDRGGKVVGRRAPRRGSREEAPSRTIETFERERVVGAAFAEGGGAVAVERESGEVWVVRFGGAGEAVGEPVQIRPGGVPLGRVHLARGAEGGWFAVRPQGEGVVSIDGVGPVPEEQAVVAADLAKGDVATLGWCSRVVEGSGGGRVALCEEAAGGDRVGLRVMVRPQR